MIIHFRLQTYRRTFTNYKKANWTQFTKDTNIVKHSTHKINRSINRAVHKLPKHTIILTTTQVQEAIQHSKNNNLVGPDNLSIRHLKHIGPLGLTFLTSIYTTALNKNIILHMWKLANLIPIPKPNKDTNMGTSYRPISLLSVVAKTLEKCLLPYATANITQTPTQHGYKAQHSTVTALHTINNTVAKGFNWTQHNNLIINPVQNHLHSVDPRSS